MLILRLRLLVLPVAAGVLLLYALLVWQAPRLVVGEGLNQVTDIADRAVVEYNARLLFVSCAGALVVVVGLAFTARTYALNQRGQVTERFAKALERLDSDELYVRLGGVHALEHVMGDSPDHHADVMEVLAAFVRARAPRARHRSKVSEEPADLGRWIHPPTSHLSAEPLPELPAAPDSDVQAALTALTRRPCRPRREPSRLDLSGVHLAGADLVGTQLGGFNLSRTHLGGASLRRARLEGTDLAETCLERADLSGTDLRRARLTDADLFCANLSGAYLYSSKMDGARLAGADLTNATLRWARLAGANLSGAYLFNADLTGAELRDANLCDADLFAANLSSADLTGASLREVDLRPVIGLPTARRPESPAQTDPELKR